MKINNKFLTLLFATLLLTGAMCDDTADETVSELEGTWVSNCFNESASEDRINTLTFSGANFTWTEVTYGTGTSCTTVTGTSNNAGTFTTGGNFTALGGQTVKELDLYIPSMSGTMYNLYYLQGSNLQLGKDNAEIGYDGSELAKRIRTVDPDRIHAKQ